MECEGKTNNWDTVANQRCSTELDPVRAGSENELNANLSYKYDYTKRGLRGPLPPGDHFRCESAGFYQT